VTPEDPLPGLRKHFRPEFLNRIDEIVVFRELTADDIAAIVDIQVRHLERRLAERKIGVKLTPGARERLAQEGFDPAFGARPLKRVIQRQIENPLALAILEGRFKEGDVVTVKAGKGEAFELARA
jgi:ATP-dependent Clp protease ATP-binding subunit ClpB